MATATLMNNPPKQTFVSQLRSMRTKFPTLANDFLKRLSFNSSCNKGSDQLTEAPEAVADLDSSVDVGIAEHSSPIMNRPNHLRFRSDVYMIPHPAKRKKGGEDAFFVCNNGVAVGVSDGVGGWADKGVDPSLYSKTLMREARACYEEKHFNDPLASLKAAAQKANKIMGSATACILSIDEAEESHAILKSANLGDSGFMLIRDGDIIHRTKEQQFHFNFPYQLGSTSRAQPTDAQLSSIVIKEGDKIILGTDGLFDNLFDYEILQILNRTKTQDGLREETDELIKKGSLDAEALNERKVSVAELIARKASEKSRSATMKTPFAQNAKANGMNVLGGKLDDITVLVATVISTTASGDDTKIPEESEQTTL